MCHLCEQYSDSSEGGGIWYLNPRNYARNMYKRRLPGEGFKGPEVAQETGERVGPTIPEIVDAMERGDPIEYDRIRQEWINTQQSRGGGGQVLPLQDAEKVMDLCSPIGLISCNCRRRYHAIDERNELQYTCMGMGVGMLKWERWPERYKGGVTFYNPEEAKEWLRAMNKRGFCHLLMLWGAPYIGGFCQCDYPDCDAIRNAVDFGLGTLKGHHVAQVDYDICNGCGICAQRCQWGALKFEVTSEKANIDQFKCYGCGLCQTGCPRGAITLIDRKNLPALAEVWR